MRVIIDRFEGDIAIAELNGEMLRVPAALFGGAKEGDAVEITVIGKPYLRDESSPHALFERLRNKKSRKNRTYDTAPDNYNEDEADSDQADGLLIGTDSGLTARSDED